MLSNTFHFAKVSRSKVGREAGQNQLAITTFIIEGERVTETLYEF